MLDPLSEFVESDVVVVISREVGESDPVFVVPRGADGLEFSASGSGAFSSSGEKLLPDVVEFDTTIFLHLTFTGLSREQYQADGLQEKICNLLVRLLDLDSSPSIIFDVESSKMSISVIQVYFPLNSISLATLQSYAMLLNSNDDMEWRTLANTYVS